MATEIENFTRQKRKKYKRLVLKAIYVIFGLYFLIDFLLFFVATPILKSFFQDKIKKETNGLFSVDFENISIELVGRRLALKNFELIPDTVVYHNLLQKNKEIPALYKITCSSLEIHKTSIVNIIAKKRLKAAELKLVDLIIELKQLPVDETVDGEMRDFVHQDLYPAISSYISEIKIDEINVINGKFNLDLNKNPQKKTTHLGYVSVSLYNFLLNKSEFEKRNRLFFANDLQINIDEYRINLSDKIHFLFAQDLNISTKKSILTAKNSGIAPLSQSDKFLNKIQNNFYHIKAPFIEMDNFNMFDLYFNKDINIGQIIIKRPKIDIVNVLKANRDEKESFNKAKEIDLSKLIAGKLNSIAVDTFIIENSRFNFYYNDKVDKPAYQANSLSIEMNNFILNESTFYDEKKVFYADAIDLKLFDFVARLPDDNMLNVASANLNTSDNLFIANNIVLNDKTSQISNNTPVRLEIPKLEISGVDFSKLYHNRNFNASFLTIENSFWDISLEKKAMVGERQNNSYLATLTSNYLRQVSIRNLKMITGTFKIRNKLNDSTLLNYQGTANFLLSDFFINKSSFSKDNQNLFFSKNFKLILKNYKQDLNDRVHEISSNSVEVSTIDSLIEINDFKISRKDEILPLLYFPGTEWIFNLNLLQVTVKGIDIQKTYNDSILDANSLSIFRPVIAIEHYIHNKKRNSKNGEYNLTQNNNQPDTSSISDDLKESPVKRLIDTYFTTINFGTTNVENADFSITDVDSAGNKEISTSFKISAKFSEVAYNHDNQKRKFSYSDNLTFRITDFFSKIARDYQVKLKQARFSSKDSIFAASIVRFFPLHQDTDSTASSTRFSFYSPEIITTQTSINQLIDSNFIDLGYLRIKNPSIAGIQSQSNYQAKNDSIKPESSKKLAFNKIKLAGIEIENGVFGWLIKLKNLEKPVLTSSINLTSGPLQIDTTILGSTRNFLSKLNILATFRNIQYLLPDTLHFLKVNRLIVHTGTKEIKGDSLYYSPLFKVVNFQEKEGLEELFIPAFQSTGFNFEKLLFDKSLNTNSIRIESPEIYYLSKEKSSQTQTEFDVTKLNLNGKIKKGILEVNTDSILVNNASISISPAKEVERKPKIFEKIFLEISGLSIDSILKDDERILNANNIAFKMKDFSYPFPEKFYTLFVKEAGFSTGEKTVFCKGLELNPDLSRTVFGNLRKKSYGLTYLKASKVLISGCNMKKFLEKGDLLAGNVLIDNLQLHTYKNNRMPMDSGLRIALPLDKLKTFNKEVQVDSIHFKNAYIGSEILGQNASENGFIDFTRINGNITNLTNRKEIIEQKNNTTMLVSGYLMDKSLLSASFHFPLDTKYGQYYYGGELDTIEINEINPLLENLVFISVSDGTIYSLKFDVSANEDYAEGKVRMIYDRLKIELLDKKRTDSIETEKRGLFSMVANSILRNSNPKRENGFVKDGRIYYERNVYKPVFNYWIMSVLSGVKSTVGIKSKELKERLKIEKSTAKYSSRKLKLTARFDRKNGKVQKKQIEKELRQENKIRKKTENQARKERNKEKTNSKNNSGTSK